MGGRGDALTCGGCRANGCRHLEPRRSQSPNIPFLRVRPHLLPAPGPAHVSLLVCLRKGSRSFRPRNCDSEVRLGCNAQGSMSKIIAVSLATASVPEEHCTRLRLTRFVAKTFRSMVGAQMEAAAMQRRAQLSKATRLELQVGARACCTCLMPIRCPLRPLATSPRAASLQAEGDQMLDAQLEVVRGSTRQTSP